MNNVNKLGLPAGFGSGPSRSSGVYEAPTDFVELPSRGKFYPKDSPLYGVEKIEVKFMTAKEEDLLVSPALQKAGIAMDRVIDSLLVDKRIKSRDLLIGDKNAILINVRKNAFGEAYEFQYLCVACAEINKSVKDLDEVGIKEIEFDDSCKLTERNTVLIQLPKSKANVEVGFLTSGDEEKIHQTIEKKTKNNLPDESLLTRYRYIIRSVNGNDDLGAVVSFLENMPILDSRFLRKKYAEINPDISLNYKHECKKCGHTNEGGVPIMADFFWPEL